MLRPLIEAISKVFFEAKKKKYGSESFAAVLFFGALASFLFFRLTPIPDRGPDGLSF